MLMELGNGQGLGAGLAELLSPVSWCPHDHLGGSGHDGDVSAGRRRGHGERRTERAIIRIKPKPPTRMTCP